MIDSLDLGRLLAIASTINARKNIVDAWVCILFPLILKFFLRYKCSHVAFTTDTRGQRASACTGLFLVAELLGFDVSTPERSQKISLLTEHVGSNKKAAYADSDRYEGHLGSENVPAWDGRSHAYRDCKSSSLIVKDVVFLLAIQIDLEACEWKKTFRSMHVLPSWRRERG